MPWIPAWTEETSSQVVSQGLVGKNHKIGHFLVRQTYVYLDLSLDGVHFTQHCGHQAGLPGSNLTNDSDQPSVRNLQVDAGNKFAKVVRQNKNFCFQQVAMFVQQASRDASPTHFSRMCLPSDSQFSVAFSTDTAPLKINWTFQVVAILWCKQNMYSFKNFPVIWGERVPRTLHWRVRNHGVFFELFQVEVFPYSSVRHDCLKVHICAEIASYITHRNQHLSACKAPTQGKEPDQQRKERLVPGQCWK